MSYSIIRLDGKIVGVAEQEGNGIGALRWFHRNKPSCSMDHACKFEGYDVEDVESLDQAGGAEAVLAGIMTRLGIRIGFEFVPFSQSKNAKGDPSTSGKPWQSLNWRCIIFRDLMGPAQKAMLSGVEYGAGVGHCPADKKQWPSEAMKRDAIAREIETGREARQGRRGEGPVVTDQHKPIIPNPVDVFASIVTDAGAIDAGSFEDWAGEYGYDTDSRSAEAIYRTCVDRGLALRSALGNETLDELRLAASQL